MFNKIALLLNKGEYPEISFSVYVDSIYSVYEYGGYPSGFYLGYPLQKIASSLGRRTYHLSLLLFIEQIWLVKNGSYHIIILLMDGLYINNIKLKITL